MTLARRAMLALGLVTIVMVAWASEAHADDRVVVLHVDPRAQLDVEALREAVERELGVTVRVDDEEPAEGLIVRAADAGQIVMIYRSQGRAIERIIDVPKAPADEIVTLSLLAGNLARDEASEILAGLRKPPPTPPAPKRQPPAVQPKPAPAPSLLSEAKPPPACAGDVTSAAPFAVDIVPYVGSSSVNGSRAVSSLALGLFGSLTGGVTGLQTASLFSVASKFVCGAQISGLVNEVSGPMTGLQFAVIANVATGPLQGLQLGAVNYAASGDGMQLGLVNVEHGDLRGAQLGAVNVATGAVGAQFGLVNYAASSSFSLGVVSIVRSGRTHVDLWGTTWGMIGAALKHGGDHFHNLYGIGIRPGSDKVRWAPILGFGVHFPFLDRFYLDVDAIAHAFFAFGNIDARSTVTELRVPFGFFVHPRFAIYAGASYSFGLSDTESEAKLGTFGVSTIRGGDFFVESWPGAVLGIQGL